MLSCIMDLPTIRSALALREMRDNLRSYDSTEPSTLYGQACIRPSANGHNLITNMFPLSITVRPNHQGLCAPGLLLQVLFYVLLIGRDGNFNRGFEKTKWITAVPGLENGTEVLVHKMSGNRSDGILGSSLRVIKIIVLDELGRSVALSRA